MTTFSSSLKLTLIGDGEQTGVWGNTTNTNLGTLLEQAICNQTTITMTGGNDYTLTSLNGAPDEARSAAIIIQGTQTGSNSVICPAKQKLYVITNNLSSGTAYFKPSGGSSIAIPNGKTIAAYCTGTAMQAVDYTATSGTATTATTATNLSGGVQGSVPFQSATGVTSYVDPVASPSSAGKVLTSNGTGNNPTWTAIPTPTVATNIANGSAGQIPYQIGANTTSFTTAGSAGQILQSTGGGAPIWTTLPSGGVISVGATSPLASSGGSSPNISLTGTVPIANGGTGASSFAAAGIPSLTGANTFTATNTYNASGEIIINTSGFDYQGMRVSQGSYSSGMSPTSVQVGASGVGIVYATGGAFDGGNGIGFINGAGRSIQISSANGFFTSAGTCYKTGSGDTWVIFTSDARAKRNITPYTKGLAELNQINPKTWEFNGLAETKEGDKGIGLIAQEIYEVVPSMRITRQGKLNPTDAEKTDIYTVNTSEMTWILTNAVKELSAKVDAQAAEIAALKAKA
jgi:hypothetical protein